MLDMNDPRVQAFKERMNGTDYELFPLVYSSVKSGGLSEEKAKEIMTDLYPEYVEYRDARLKEEAESGK